MKLKSKTDIFGQDGIPAVRIWIREALESWFATGDGASYEPFHGFYQLHLEPSEILADIYRSLGAEKRNADNRSEKGLFRQAAADLILEPQTFVNSPHIYRELLRLGAELGVNEVVESLAAIARSGNLPGEIIVTDDQGNTRTYDLLDEAIEAVEGGHFANKSALEFFDAIARSLGDNGEHAPVVLENLARLAPEKWCEYANLLAEPLNNYRRSKIGQPDFGYALNTLREALSRTVGPSRYAKYAPHLKLGENFSSLDWLLPRILPVDQLDAEERRVDYLLNLGTDNIRERAALRASRSGTLYQQFLEPTRGVPEEGKKEFLKEDALLRERVRAH